MFAVTSHTIAAAGVARAAADARGVRGARAARASSARGVGGARIGGRVAMGASKASRRAVRTAATEGAPPRRVPSPRRVASPKKRTRRRNPPSRPRRSGSPPARRPDPRPSGSPETQPMPSDVPVVEIDRRRRR